MSATKTVLFLDIDNCLYSASSGISAAMGKRIHAYFRSMGLEEDEASALHLKYYTTYGLALRGLIIHHNIDPLDFDQKCDGSLPLEDLIKPNPTLRKLLQDIDPKVKIWGLTNAYRPHAERVLRILGVDDLMDGLVFCDYQKPNFSCKPDPQFYHDALVKAKVSDVADVYFIDDSRINVDAAQALGWGHVVHFCETGLVHVEGGKVKEISEKKGPESQNVPAISNLEDMRKVWPELFKK
ncbi:pyrimidine 5-nucleotidase [Mycena filopes]|nr:pyrimidine 5-nucleotidase [Mycena filopes]